MDNDNTKAQSQSADIEMFYFTGTGNTLYIVKRFQEIVPDTTVKPIVPLIKEGKRITPTSSIIGLCYPNHAGHLPIPMQMFLHKLCLKGNEYVFAICNSAFSKSFSRHDINKALKRSLRS